MDATNQPAASTPEFKQYRRKELSDLRPYVAGETLATSVTISADDAANGSPKEGDMIARDPKNHANQWLVNKAFFEDKFALAEPSA